MSVPAMLDRVSSDAQLARPLGDGQAFAVPFNPMGQRSILVLLKAVRPSAVSRHISQRVIDAIERVAIWTRSHVGEKVHERCAPAWSDNQSLRAIAVEQLRIRVVAALEHALPDPVFAAFVHAVPRVRPADGFAVFTAARRLARMQRIAPHDASRAAFAPAFPKGLLVAVPSRSGCASDDRQTTVNLACSIDDWSSHKDKSYHISKQPVGF